MYTSIHQCGRNYRRIQNKQNRRPLLDSTIGCEYNGECLEKNEKRFDKSSCTNFVCAFSKKQNRLVLKERIAGITEYYHSSIEVRKICLIFISFYILVYQKKYKKVNLCRSSCQIASHSFPNIHRCIHILW
jgi:hypothetical protein